MRFFIAVFVTASFMISFWLLSRTIQEPKTLSCMVTFVAPWNGHLFSSLAPTIKANIESYFGTSDSRLVIVDSGSASVFVEFLKELRHAFNFELVEGKTGVACSKQVCLDIFRNSGEENLFLFDQDVFFKRTGWAKEYMDTAQSIGVAHLTHVDREFVVKRGKGVVVGKQPSGAFVFLKRRAVERVGKVAGEFSDWISAKLHKEMEFVDIASSSQFFKVQQRDPLLALSNSPKLEQYSGEVAKEVDVCAVKQIRVNVFVVFDETRSKWFDDWLQPLFKALEVCSDVFLVPLHETVVGKPNGSTARILQKKSRAGDIILFVQVVHGVNASSLFGRHLWLLGTEGVDKSEFYDDALKNGVRRVIGYSPWICSLLLQKGFQKSLWLPIVATPGVAMSLQRKHMCMVGGAMTEYRKRIWSDLQMEALKRGLEISFLAPKGWKSERDLVAQECLLVINCRSVQNNEAMPRLRVDILWQYDIFVVSESMNAIDESEYMGTVSFASVSTLVNRALDEWEHLQQSQKAGVYPFPNRTKSRIAIKLQREAQFRKVLNAILKEN